MNRFQSLLASFSLAFVLAVALAASAAASAGTIHTGSPAAQLPTPTPENMITDDSSVKNATGGGEPVMLDYAVEAALDCLHAAFTLF